MKRLMRMSLGRMISNYEKPKERDEVLRFFFRTDFDLSLYGESALEAYVSFVFADKVISDVSGCEPVYAQYDNDFFYAAYEVLRMQRIKGFIGMSMREILRGVSFSAVRFDSEGKSGNRNRGDGGKKRKSSFSRLVYQSHLRPEYRRLTAVFFYGNGVGLKKRGAILLRELSERFCGVNFVVCHFSIAPEFVRKGGSNAVPFMGVFFPYDRTGLRLFFGDDMEVRGTDVFNKGLSAYDFVAICRDFVSQDAGQYEQDGRNFL